MEFKNKLVWNGNELVFENDPNKGVAGIAPNIPDELGKEIARRWNLHEITKDGKKEKGS